MMQALNQVVSGGFLAVGLTGTGLPAGASAPPDRSYPALPEAVASLGAATLDGIATALRTPDGKEYEVKADETGYLRFHSDPAGRGRNGVKH